MLMKPVPEVLVHLYMGHKYKEKSPPSFDHVYTSFDYPAWLKAQCNQSYLYNC